jgi:hypothetical protein
MQRHVRGGWLGLIAVFGAGLSGSLGAQTAHEPAAKPAMAAVAPVNAKIFPLADVRRGLHGVA